MADIAALIAKLKCHCPLMKALPSIAAQYNHISFDVFDTLVTRKTATPTGTFALMQKELAENHPEIDPYLSRNFWRLRTQAEAFARRIHYDKTKGILDVTLEQIYHVIRDNLALTHEETDLLLNLELQTEMQNVIPLEENIAVLKRLHAEGKNVFCISNMYLSEKQIRAVLNGIDPIFRQLRIYVSSEYRQTKTTGELFRIVGAEQNIAFSEWLHVGDNMAADVRSPRKLGIAAYHYRCTALEKYESMLLNGRLGSAALQVNIGISRNLRRMKKMSEKQALGCSLFAPMLLLYVRWLLGQALKRNIKRLYFIARDGYILKEMADTLIREQGLDIQTAYIYGSRITWRIFDGDKSVLAYFFDEYGSLNNPKLIAERLGVDYSEFASFLPPNVAQNPTCVFKKREERDAFRNQMLNNDDFLCWLLSKHHEKKNNLIGYLKQEIDFSDEHFAFVDFRGSGHTADFLADIIKNFYPEKITTFYFQMLENPHCERSWKFSMFLSAYDNIFLELLTRAPHGCTIAYEQREGKYHPVLDNEGEELVKYGYKEIVDGVKLFVEAYVKSGDMGDDEGLLLMYTSYFSFIATNIDRKNARMLGTIPYDRIVSNRQQQVYAEKITFLDVLRMMVGRSVGAPHSEKMRLARSSRHLREWYLKLKKSSFRKMIFDDKK